MGRMDISTYVDQLQSRGSVPTSVGTRISRFPDSAHERDSKSGTRSAGKVSFGSASLTWAERDSSFVVTL